MHWILQSNLFREKGMEELRDYLENNEIPYSEHKVIPFIGKLEPDSNATDKVVCFGSYSMRHVAKEKKWEPGVFEVPDYDICTAKWGTHLMLNGDASVTNVESLGEEDLQWYPDPFFIRPVSDAKYFAGMIISHDDWLLWRHKIVVLEEDNGSSLRANTMVMIASPKKICQEYRFWIVDRQIVTSSMYKMGSRVLYQDETSTPQGASNLAHFICDYMWQPARAYVMDICLTDDDEWKIVEVNCMNAAGLYAANIPKLVNAIDRMQF